MRVNVESSWGKPLEMSVASYIDDFRPEDDGAVECAQHTAEHGLEVLGRLVQMLASKGILNLAEIDVIKNGRETGELRQE